MLHAESTTHKLTTLFHCLWQASSTLVTLTPNGRACVAFRGRHNTPTGRAHQTFIIITGTLITADQIKPHTDDTKYHSSRENN